jgi:hypothetical protein
MQPETADKESILNLNDPIGIALEGARHLDRFLPLRFDAPPEWLATAIDKARDLGKLGNRDAAREVMQTTLSNADQRRIFSAYRDKITYIESQNAKRLGALAWTWDTLDKLSKRLADKPDPKYDRVEIEQLLLQVERFSFEHWLLAGLSAVRGWAESRVKQTLLPPAWLTA